MPNASASRASVPALVSAASLGGAVTHESSVINVLTSTTLWLVAPTEAFLKSNFASTRSIRGSRR